MNYSSSITEYIYVYTYILARIHNQNIRLLNPHLNTKKLSISEPRHDNCLFLLLTAIHNRTDKNRRLGRSLVQFLVPTWGRRLLRALKRCRSQLGTGSQLGTEQTPSRRPHDVIIIKMEARSGSGLYTRD